MLRNIDPCSCNHCYRAKGISIKYSECVFVALGIQHAMHMRLIVMCSRPVSTLFSRFMSKQHVFREQVTEYKMCSLISHTNFSAHSKKKWERYAYKCVLVWVYNARYS